MTRVHWNIKSESDDRNDKLKKLMFYIVDNIDKKIRVEWIDVRSRQCAVSFLFVSKIRIMLTTLYNDIDDCCVSSDGYKSILDGFESEIISEDEKYTMDNSIILLEDLR